ncbi:MAG: FecR domain-containing protein [Methylococcales bacterium]
MDCFQHWYRIKPVFVFVSFFLLSACLIQLSSAHADDWVYTVEPGDNLWDLSERYLSSMRYLPDLQALNKIVDPRVLPPGSKLMFPLPWLKSSSATAKIIGVKGEVTVSDDAIAENLTATLGSTVKTGDEIITASDASVTLEFSDKSRVQLQSDGHLILKDLKALGETGIADTLLHLKKGQTVIKVKPQRNQGSRFEISTPSAIAAVRGTEYRINSDVVRAESRAEVLEGKVAVSSAGATVVTPKGFGTLIKKGHPPSHPIRLLPAPDLSMFPSVIRQLPIEFNVTPLTGAISYHAEIIVDNGNDALEFATDLASPATLTVYNLIDGDYFLHVRGIDRYQLGGINGLKQFSVNTVPQIPKPMPTNSDRSFNTPHSTFRWLKVENAQSYQFQLSTEMDFASPMIDATVLDKTTFTVSQTIAPGRYYWRVAAVNNKNQSGFYSDPQKIEVNKENKFWFLMILIPLVVLVLLALTMIRRKHG